MHLETRWGYLISHEVRLGSGAQMLLHILVEKGGGLSSALRWPLSLRQQQKVTLIPQALHLGLEGSSQVALPGKGPWATTGLPLGYLSPGWVGQGLGCLWA